MSSEFCIGADELDELIVRIQQAWPFDTEHYPPLHDGTNHGTLAWRRRAAVELRAVAAEHHVIAHLAKQTGKLAALVEPGLHGKPTGTPDAVARSVAHTIIDVLRLCSLTGVSGADVLRHIEAWESES